MADWGNVEDLACHELLAIALQEDLSNQGDLTSKLLLPAEREGRAVMVVRGTGIVAGLPAARLVFQAVNPAIKFDSHVIDGTAMERSATIASVAGPVRSILTAERTALNFLQHLSGIATLTRRYVNAVQGLKARIHDTRKTLPGWRILEKYAVRAGGGQNHRMGLYDGVLIKDNHLAALREAATTIGAAVAWAQSQTDLPIEVEVDSLPLFDLALAARPSIILLDNVPVEQMREAVRRRDASAPEISLEASGGVTLTTVRAIAETGVERISVGALTHSAPALDIALDYVWD